MNWEGFEVIRGRYKGNHIKKLNANLVDSSTILAVVNSILIGLQLGVNWIQFGFNPFLLDLSLISLDFNGIVI